MIVTIVMWLAALLIAVVLGIAAGTVVSSLRDRPEDPDVSNLLRGTAQWSLEFWDIEQGLRLQTRFSGGVILGRGKAGTRSGDLFAVGLSPTISREQCLVYDQGGGLMVWNLSDVNPTLHNGHQLGKPEVLQAGDRLVLGSSSYLVTALEPV